MSVCGDLVRQFTMICKLAVRVKDPVRGKISDLFDSINDERFETGDIDMPLHLPGR